MKKAFLISALVVALASCGGNYVITQQLSHNIFSGDAFIEFSAKDKNSPVSGIRVYYVSAEIDFERDIVEHAKLNGKLKEIEPPFPDDFYEYVQFTIQDQGTESFDADGIFFSLAEDEQLFVFDGKYFVKGYRHYDYDDAEE